MTRWCKLMALVVGWSGLSAAAQAQEAPPAAPAKWSLFRRVKATQDDLPPPAPSAPGLGGPVAPIPEGTPPMRPQPQTGAPPLPPFVAPQMPPAQAPEGPGGVPNGFTDPLPPDAMNGFEPNPQEPDLLPARQCYFGIDYIHWWVQKQPVPVLVTTGDIIDKVPGAFAQPNTKFFLDDISNGGAHDGVRLMAAYDFDRDGILGVDASWFWLNLATPTAEAGGDGGKSSRVLTRPFFNTVTRLQDADPINFPGVMAGTLTAQTPLRLMGADANLRWLVNPSPVNGPRWTLMAGVRWVALDEKLLIDEGLTDVSGLGTTGNHYALSENFTTYNRFYGAQFGMAVDHRIGPVVVQLVGKVAFGQTQEYLRISGFTVVNEPSGVVTSNSKAALYVGPGNVGRYSDQEFAVLPEGQFKVAYEFNDYVRMNVGYDVFYLSRVIRPGKQINSDVNVQPVGSPVPVGPLDPTFVPFRASGFWAQGFNVGLEINF